MDIMDIICDFGSLLNKNNIKFYLVGAIGAYIDANLNLTRKHDDIDILIEEKDVVVLKSILYNTIYHLKDSRFYNNRVLNSNGYVDGTKEYEHEIIINIDNSNIHIGLFLYRMSEDTYTLIDYFFDGKMKKLERSLPIRYFYNSYDDTPKIINNVKIFTVRKEYVYKNKLVSKREKDLYDIKLLEPFIDENILLSLNNMHKYRITKIIEVGDNS